MFKRFVLGGVALALGLALVLPLSGKAYGQGTDDKKLVWKHGLKFQVRKAGEKEFTDKTQQYGAEIFHDKVLGQLVYIGEKGDVSLGSAVKADGIGADVKAPKLFYALELTVREVGESKFEGGKVKKFGIEVFNDPNAENLVYITETGRIAVIPTSDRKAPESVKNPDWFHGLEVKVRKAGENDFDKASKVSLEVYKDENSNQLVYITDGGAIAICPAGTVAKPKSDDIKNPTWFHAFELKVRPAADDKFDKAKKIGVEVYKDENAGTLLFVSETGSIAVVPAGNVTKPAKSADPTLVAGRAFSVRTANEPNFTEKTQKYGAEIYNDPNSNMKVYVTESGALCVTK